MQACPGAHRATCPLSSGLNCGTGGQYLQILFWLCHLIALRAGAVEQAAAAEALEAGPRLLLLPPRLGEPQLLGLARAGPGRTVAAARVAEARGHVLGLCELAHGRHEGGGGAEQGEGQVGGPAAPHRLCSTEGLARTGDISTYLHI